ncbi:MAG: DUF1846 domain-containing protein [Oscillospiraceae bacterium]|nr:DUF1846 domain-containing protein [Oscillospiraceae bacterium]
MLRKIGFDNEKYLRIQSAKIRERIEQFGGKLYLEFGGKLFDDYHAARVLPGFAPDSKIHMLKELAPSVEIVIAVNAADIAQNKVRGDLGITYGDDVLRLIDQFRQEGLYVGSVVITRYAGQTAADLFRSHLISLGMKVYLHYPIPGYPHDVARIVSEEGFGKNDDIITQRPLVVVTAPGPGSGKMATCLSQLYHEQKRGVSAGYAKFETFPVWNLPLKHPVHLAYEAATADLDDVNMIDPFHLQAYGVTAVNYNRDVEVFPVLQAIFTGLYGSSPYRSPTDMGVNTVADCIVDEQVVSDAALQEIVRRYFAAACARRKGSGTAHEVFKLELLMKQAGITDAIRPCVAAANKLAAETNAPAVAIELPDGTLIGGKTSELMEPLSAALLNALKELGGIDPKRHLIARSAIEPIQRMKTDCLRSATSRLRCGETLIALAISASEDEFAAKALEQIPALQNCEAHSSVIVPDADAAVYSRLGMHLTESPQYQSSSLYHNNN